MGKHSKTGNDGPVFSQYERTHMGLEMGTQRMRLQSDHLRRFGSCAVCLDECKDPVVTPAGFLYCRQCILESLLAQRQSLKQQERKRAVLEQEREEEQKRQCAEAQLQQLEVLEQSAVLSATALASGEVLNAALKRSRNFWLPENVPKGLDAPSVRPEQETPVCPMSRKPLRVKDLVTVRFERKDGQYVCPLTRAELNNTSRAFVVRPTGRVFAGEARKYVDEERRDPIDGTQLKLPGDIIPLNLPGSVYAGSGGDDKHATAYKTPSMI